MEANRNQTGCLKTTLILVGAAIIFIAAIILIGDFKCAYDVEDWWMPLYPKGETVDVQYDLFRPRAWGTTTWIMTTTDDVDTVKQFYRDRRLFTLKNKTKGIAAGDSRVLTLEDGMASARDHYDSIPQEQETEKSQALARLKILEKRLEDGHRSQIILYSACGL